MLKGHSWLRAAVCLVLLALNAAADETLVDTALGQAQGFWDPQAPSVRVWLGLPFAQPPVGSLRFAPPQPAAAWSPAVRNFTSFTPACMQSGFPVKVGGPTPAPSEDCLYLNVYSPASANASHPLAVMVWIHGGGFSIGWATQTPGNWLALYGNVVVVTVDYRMGAFGFSAWQTQSGSTTSNYGLLDQRMAFQWVSHNIAAFGGDPQRITIFGESAGGGSVIYHMSSPPSWPYFSAGIVESGGVWALAPMERTLNASLTLAASVNCSQAADVLACVRSVPATLLTQPNGGAPWAASAGFLPTVDQDFSLQPLVAIKQGKWKQTPLMIGWAIAEEGLIGLVDSATSPKVPMPVSSYHKHMASCWGAADDPAGVLSFAQQQYPPQQANVSNWYQVAFSVTDWALLFRCPQLLDQGLIASSSPVYMYSWTHLPSQWIFDSLGPTHTVEIPFVFGNATIEGMAWNSDEVLFSQQIMAMWGSFASSFIPSSAWPDYRHQQLVQVLQIPLSDQVPSPYPKIGDPTPCFSWQPYLEQGIYPQPNH